MKDLRACFLSGCVAFVVAVFLSAGAFSLDSTGASAEGGVTACSDVENHPVCLARGDAAPRFRLRDLGNRWRSLDEFTRGGDQAKACMPGLPLVIDFFAMNCAVCREMMPMLVDFARNNAGRVQVMVIAITDPSDRGDRKLREYFRRAGAKFPVLTDSKGAEAGRWVEIRDREAVLPQLFLLDGSGIVRGIAGGRHESIESALPELGKIVAP